MRRLLDRMRLRLRSLTREQQAERTDKCCEAAHGITLLEPRMTM